MARDSKGRFVKSIDPANYFNQLKNKKQSITNETLGLINDNALLLLEKYSKTNQYDAMRKVIYHIDTLEKEYKAIAAGVDTFVYLSDVKEYIENVEDRIVKIIELERYEREIPDEVVSKYEKVKEVFDKFFVVFTDYTGDHVNKTRKERDPILFGMFQSKELEVTNERLYFIGDWVDEYCDLTLERLVAEMKRMDPAVESIKAIELKTVEDFKAKIKALDEEKYTTRMSSFSNTAYVINSVTTPSTIPSEEKEEMVDVIFPSEKKDPLTFWQKLKAKWKI